MGRTEARRNRGIDRRKEKISEGRAELSVKVFHARIDESKR